MIKSKPVVAAAVRQLPTKTHEAMVAEWMTDPAFKEELERLEREEFALLDALLEARDNSGLTQAEIAKRMGTKPPAVSRLLNSLASDKQSPSVATLRKYAKACGKHLEIRLV